MKYLYPTAKIEDNVIWFGKNGRWTMVAKEGGRVEWDMIRAMIEVIEREEKILTTANEGGK